ncbi:hypothetical protein L1049_026662 [Liquidambar formosana]|uniref:Calcium uniporter protein C-terminal domain-containing protein n=1 Tax=Liquidambar formosana TaxID=63359 RepID=A0AAP0NE44_LIQFO
MALRKALSQRLSNISRAPSPASPLETSPISSPSSKTFVPPNAAKTNFHREYLTSPEPGENGFFRRFLQRRGINQSSSRLPEFLSLPVGDKLKERLRGMNPSVDRLRLDGIIPPAPAINNDSLDGISVQSARKILRLAQVEKLKSRLREIRTNSISYTEFVRICVEACSNEDQGVEFAKMLDESGNVIVLGNVVFLRPEQVAESMRTIISQSIAIPNDPRRKELEEMEKQKALIEQKAKSLVQKEIRCGLGFVVLQHLYYLRLTFWELSWDVMEPICYFTSSLYVVAGFMFFLRTSAEPSFEGYSRCRFKAKQKQLMKAHNFDIQKYNELQKAFYSHNYSSKQLSSVNHEEGVSQCYA